MADNVLTYKGDGIIQIMSTSELNALSQAVLEYMATNDGPGGIYTSNVGNASFTLIGTFTDTKFAGGIGEGNVTILSSEYNLYQDLTTPTGTEPPRPLRYGSTVEPMRAMTTTQLEDLANTILQYGLNNEGPHSFVLESSAPADGGTWTSLGQIKDIYSGGAENPKYLYKKLTSGLYTLNRPLKSLGNGTIQAFTTTEVNYLAKKVRERIVNTGIGQYRFQATAPTPGTWVEKGSIIDTRATETSGVLYAQNYVTGSPTEYTGSETGIYTTDINTDYTGAGDIAYTGTGSAEYSGAVLTPLFTSTEDTYAGDPVYNLDTPASYALTPVYTGDVATLFTGAVTFTATYDIGYDKTFASYYAGTGPDVTPYSGTVFQSFATANYLGDTYNSLIDYTTQTVYNADLYTGSALLFFVQQNVTRPDTVGVGFLNFYTDIDLYYTGPSNLQYTENVIPEGSPLPVRYIANYTNEFTGTTYFNAAFYTSNSTDFSRRDYYQGLPLVENSWHVIMVDTGYDGSTPTGFYTGTEGPATRFIYNVADNYTDFFDPVSWNAYYVHDTTYYAMFFAFYEHEAGLYTATFIQPSYFDLEYHGIIYTLGYVTTYATTVTSIGGYLGSLTTYTGITNYNTETGYTSSFYTGGGGPDFLPYYNGAFGSAFYTGAGDQAFASQLYIGGYIADTPATFSDGFSTVTFYTSSYPTFYITNRTYYTATLDYTTDIIYQLDQSYTGTGTTYNLDYTGLTPVTYSGIGPLSFGAYFTQTYLSNYQTNYDSTTNYTGVVPTPYTASNLYYDTVLSSTYTSADTYTGPAITYNENYTGSSITDVQNTISTIKLWRRVA